MNDNNVFKKNIDESFNENDIDSRNSKYIENNCVYNFSFLKFDYFQTIFHRSFSF